MSDVAVCASIHFCLVEPTWSQTVHLHLESSLYSQLFRWCCFATFLVSYEKRQPSSQQGHLCAFTAAGRGGAGGSGIVIVRY